ncbi:MAG: imidazolonepropionase-like amidohydrolase [Chlamydiales bacterium]
MLALHLILALMPGVQPSVARDAGVAIEVAKVLALDDENHVYQPGMIWVEDGKISYVGASRPIPVGMRSLSYPDAWATPGLVDLHTHIHTGGWGDINDMVLAVNPGLRVAPTVRPANALMRRACVSGVTTLFGIPGSGTNISGFGVLYKTKGDARYDRTVFADPGGMKAAQDSNPQRRAGDLGYTRAGMGWILENTYRRAQRAFEQDRFDLSLEQLKRVYTKELPVLIHTAGSDGVVNTARMWRVTFDTRSVLSHGSFDGWKAARAVAEMGMPVNHGPRTIDYPWGRNGRINGTAAEFVAAGVPLFSLNTDSGIIPQEEFFLQASMSARYGADPYDMLRAVTIHPAKAFGIDDRVGSLEVGKDADIVLRSGDPLDPRASIELVLIDGQIEYDRERDGLLF